MTTGARPRAVRAARGTDSAAATDALTWTTAVENGRKRAFCDTCSRDHLRAMEAKLDSEYW